MLVVGQLLSLAAVTASPEPDDALLDVNVAVRLAGVIDEAGYVAADAGVHRRAGGDGQGRYRVVPARPPRPAGAQQFRAACDTNFMSRQPKVKIYREVTMYRVT